MSISFKNVFKNPKNDDDDDDDDEPMSDNTLYGLDNAEELDSSTWTRFKKIALDWLGQYIFRSSPRYMETKQPIPESHKKLILRCTEELIDLVYESHNSINRNMIQSISAACFIISMKLFYGNDYVSDRHLVSFLADASNDTTKNLIELEKNIMKKTNWKGCGTYSLDKIYDDEVDPTGMFGKRKKSVRKTKKSVRKMKSVRK